MENSFNLARRIFFGLGERIAFILVIIFFTLIFFVETTHQAFSEEEEVYVGFSQDGLTYDTYLSSPVSYSIDLEVSVSSPYVKEETYEHIVIKDPEPAADPSNSGIWEAIAACESGGNWSINTGNGYYGGLQFSQGAWNSVGGTGLPSDASKEEQIEKGKALQEKRGWGVWGLCAKKLGL